MASVIWDAIRTAGRPAAALSKGAARLAKAGFRGANWIVAKTGAALLIEAAAVVAAAWLLAVATPLPWWGAAACAAGTAIFIVRVWIVLASMAALAAFTGWPWPVLLALGAAASWLAGCTADLLDTGGGADGAPPADAPRPKTVRVREHWRTAPKA